MNFGMSILGDIKKDIDRDIGRFEDAAMSASREVSDGAKQDWRSQISSAGLGKRLGNTVRSRVYPQRTKSFNPSGVVWTNAPEIIRSFELGMTIEPTGKGAKYIAVPTKFAPVKGGMVGNHVRKGNFRSRISPSNWPSDRYGTLVFIAAKGSRPAMLVVEDMRRSKAGTKNRNKRGRQFRLASEKFKGTKFIVPMFVLVPRVRMPKLLDVKSLERKWAEMYPGIFDNQVVSRGLVS